MEWTVFESREALYQASADLVSAAMAERKTPLFCAASGDSPRGLYQELADRVTAGKLTVGDWRFLGLDEWLGLGPDDQGSCRHMLDQDLFMPLHVPQNHIRCFDGLSTEPEVECRAIEAYLLQRGPIDMAVLGLGMNGHIGLNEPGTPPGTRSHVSRLSALTEKTGQKYFDRPVALRQGLTLGLGNLQEARSLLLIVSGAHKADMLRRLVQGPETAEVPATLLRGHPRLRLYTEPEAAALLDTH